MREVNRVTAELTASERVRFVFCYVAFGFAERLGRNMGKRLLAFGDLAMRRVIQRELNADAVEEFERQRMRSHGFPYPKENQRVRVLH